MENLVREGLFREDLYYRLNVVEIHLPLLRDRGKDVELLIHHFVERFSLEHGKRIMGVSPDAMGALKGWQYPGNVRELQNAIERAVALSIGNILQIDDLPGIIGRAESLTEDNPEDFPDDGVDLDALLTQIERRWLTSALEATEGKKMLAAKKLKLSFRSFRYRLLKHNLE